MASVLNVKESKAFCDEVFTELTKMKAKLLELSDRSTAGRMQYDIDGGKFGRQLTELADHIEWRLQILSHSCPFDWQGSADYEGPVEIEAEKAKDIEFAPGYIGG